MVRKSRRLNPEMASQEELAEMERLSANFAPETKVIYRPFSSFSPTQSRVLKALKYGRI